MKRLETIIVLFGTLQTVAFSLDWVPRQKLETPFITFVNDLYDPSWMTTNNQTFQQDVKYVITPIDVHFGAICVGCVGADHDSSINFTTVSKDITYVVQKDPSNNERWIVGENICVVSYNIFRVRGKTQSLYCEINVNGEEYNYKINVFSSIYRPIYNVIREEIVVTDKTALDCTMNNNNNNNSRDGFNNSLFLTMWWYEKKEWRKYVSIPKYISKKSKYPSFIDISKGDVLGCITYEMRKFYNSRVNQKLFRWINTASFDDSVVTFRNDTTVVPFSFSTETIGDGNESASQPSTRTDFRGRSDTYYLVFFFLAGIISLIVIFWVKRVKRCRSISSK